MLFEFSIHNHHNDQPIRSAVRNGSRYALAMPDSEWEPKAWLMASKNPMLSLFFCYLVVYTSPIMLVRIGSKM